MKLLPIAVAVIALFPGSALGSGRPIKTTVTELLKHSAAYKGKIIDVTGYLVTSCEHCAAIYASYEAEQRDPLSGKWIHLGKFSRNIRMPNAFRRRINKRYPEYDGYIHVIGRFEFVDMTNAGRVISETPPNREGVSAQVIYIPTGFGWMGTESRQVTDITLLEPIAPELPSRIEDYLRRLAKEHSVR